MTKKARVVIVICLLALTSLSFSNFPTLDSIRDLIREVSKRSVPLHAVILLYWFANNSEMDNNNRLCISFNPYGDFGSHHYGNFDGLLEKPKSPWSYFTVGSIYSPLSGSLPDYFREIQFREDGINTDRIILCASRVVQNSGTRTITEVYLTRHFQQQQNQPNTAYDPNRTFIISTNLLNQLRQFASDNYIPSLNQLRNLRNQFNNNINDNQLRDLINTWQKEARLGLLLLIVSPHSYRDAAALFIKCKSKSRFSRDLTVNVRCEWQNCKKEDFRVTAGRNGYARINWKNVPQEQLDDGVAVALFRNQNKKTSITYKKITASQGSYDTSVLLNEGFQVRLYKRKLWWITDEICRGKEFKSPPATSVDRNLQLQLFVRDGKACFRLSVKYGGYKYIYEHYYHHWVGLYSSVFRNSENYLSGQWQWVTKFEQGQSIDLYDTFEYCTSTTITVGLQARMLKQRGQVYYVYTRAQAWTDQHVPE